jgi:hypothetical protein
MLRYVTDDAGVPLALTVTVDYRATLGDLVAAGKYRYPDPDITPERFWRTGEVQRTISFRILRADVRLSHADVEAAIAATGLRAVTPLELLSACTAMPDVPSDGRVAALGVVWHDERTSARRVTLVQRYNGSRYLDLHPLHFLWHVGDQFLVAPADGGAP